MISWFRRLFEQRDEQVQGGENVVLDLDQLTPQPVRFRMYGKIHSAHPVSVGQFGEIYNAISKIDSLAVRKKLSGDRLYRSYIRALRPVCPTLTAIDLAKMSRLQQVAFFLFVFKVISGEGFDPTPTTDAEKKN